MIIIKSKILITNTNVSWNKGSAAQVISLICSLRRLVPEVEFTLLSYCPELDSSCCSRYDINIVGFRGRKDQKYPILLLIYSFHLWLTILRCGFYSFLSTLKLSANNPLIRNATVNAYIEADLILDLSGDSFSDWQNRSIIGMLGLLPAILLRKQFVFFSQSIGPFNSWTLPFARFCLESSNLIVIREEVTKRYLESIGVKNRNLLLAGDCAYLLEPTSQARILEILKDNNIKRQEQPLIGVSVSVFMMNHFFRGQGNQYLSVMSKIVDYLVESKSAYVMLVPHSINPSCWGSDDVYAVKGVYRLVKNKNRVRFIKNDYDPRELKGIIGFCDFFIGCRMHANIAAISQNIPTVALGWSHKYYGIMKRVGLEAYVLNLENLSFEELKAKIDELFSIRKKTQKELAITTKNEYNSALEAIKLTTKLLFANQRN